MEGSKKDPGARPDTAELEPIELWMYEGSPYARPVRERLTALCLPHTVVYCPRGGPSRDEMFQRLGRFQVPFLSDPNTGCEMFEGGAMVEYLDEVYRL